MESILQKKHSKYAFFYFYWVKRIELPLLIYLICIPIYRYSMFLLAITTAKAKGIINPQLLMLFNHILLYICSNFISNESLKMATSIVCRSSKKRFCKKIPQTFGNTEYIHYLCNALSSSNNKVIVN